MSNILSLNAATTAIPTASYVQLTAGTPVQSAKIYIVNTTSSIVVLAYGASGNEVDLIAIRGGSSEWVSVGTLATLPPSQRLALKALDTAATTGYIAVSLLP